MSTDYDTPARHAAVILGLEGHKPRTIAGDRIYLETPAGTLNATERLQRAGYDATSHWDGNGWYIRISGQPGDRPIGLEAVLAAVRHDQARTTMEVAEAAAGHDAWRQRTNVRNRLYELEEQGRVICDEARPMRWLRPS